MKKQVTVYDNCYITRDKGEFAGRGAMVWYGYYLPSEKTSFDYRVPFDKNRKRECGTSDWASNNDLYRHGHFHLPNEFFKDITFRNKPKKCKVIIEIED